MPTNNLNKRIAEQLLQIYAIKINTANPYTWASGWKSPIYCDNRKTLSYTKVRDLIKHSFVELITKKFSNVEGIAGVATGAIAIGVLVADLMDLPFIYIRPSAKQHGLTNMIEGEYSENQKFVVVEDLVSTGKSSLKAVEALRTANCEVLGMTAIFSYMFSIAEINFKSSNCELYTLSNYNVLIETAKEMNYIKQSEIETLLKWREAPENWK